MCSDTVVLLLTNILLHRISECAWHLLVTLFILWISGHIEAPSLVLWDHVNSHFGLRVRSHYFSQNGLPMGGFPLFHELHRFLNKLEFKSFVHLELVSQDSGQVLHLIHIRLWYSIPNHCNAIIFFWVFFFFLLSITGRCGWMQSEWITISVWLGCCSRHSSSTFN